MTVEEARAARFAIGAEPKRHRSAAYVDLVYHLFSRYMELFPTYAWVDAESALETIAREVRKLRRSAPAPITDSAGDCRQGVVDTGVDGQSTDGQE